MTGPKWKRFEKLIHDIHTQLAPAGAVVKLDDKIVGCFSKTPRQLDITIRVRIAQYDVLIVVECKDQARPIDVTELDSFANKLEDVKANKGVMISTSGYTPAAVNTARAKGIDTRTYIDTDSVDWRKEIAIPVLLVIVKLNSWAAVFSGVPGYRGAAPTNIPFPLIKTFAEDGTPLGPIIVLLGKKWNNDKSLHEPGEHRIKLAEHVIINVGGTPAHVKIEAILKVERCYYRGLIPITFAGFKDEQDGSLLAKEIRTDSFAPTQIARGEVPGWTELTALRNGTIDCIVPIGTGQGNTPTFTQAPRDDTIPIDPVMLVMHFVDAVPEEPDDLKLPTTLDTQV